MSFYTENSQTCDPCEITAQSVEKSSPELARNLNQLPARAGRPGGRCSGKSTGRVQVAQNHGGGLATPAAVQCLSCLLAELEGSRLEVVLVPCRRACNEGGCYRVAASKNAEWYRRFCAQHASSRRRNRALFDTKIKRANVVSVLTRLIEKGQSRSQYAPELLRIAARYRLEAVA